MARSQEIQLPPQCGLELSKPFLYNPYQAALLRARRLRICPQCYVLGPVGDIGVFRCGECGRVEGNQAIAKKAFGRIGIVGGRRSGKSRVGAQAALEEVTVPNGLGWVCGPSFKMLHDSTMPTFFKILPPSWVKHWSAGNYELTLKNNHIIQFRSLDDPERGRGQGPTWSWLDEVQKMREKAWDVFRPSLTENSGNAIFTFTPNGFDWTWNRLWRPAAEVRPATATLPAWPMAGFWMAKCRTLDNPWIQRYGLDEIREARATMPAPMFRQEYEADFVSFVGNVYDWEQIEPRILHEDGLLHFIPEWPAIDKSRELVLGFHSQPGHPSAAVLLVVTEFGVIAVRDYINDHRAVAFHLDNIGTELLEIKQDGHVVDRLEPRWTHNEEFEFVSLEAARKGVGITPTSSYVIDGIQRVQSWLYMNQLFIADNCQRLLDQLRGYRWADNDKEEIVNADRIYALHNELPNALQSALLSWPSLLEKSTPATGRDLSKMDPNRRAEIERMSQYEREQEELDHINFGDPGYPFGSAFSGVSQDS